jgi:hypothetical protein
MHMSLGSSVRTVPICTWRNFNVQYKQGNFSHQPFPKQLQGTYSLLSNGLGVVLHETGTKSVKLNTCLELMLQLGI